MGSDSIIIELCEVSQNMNWLNGCALVWTLAWLWVRILVVPLNFLFARIMLA